MSIYGCAGMANTYLVGVRPVDGLRLRGRSRPALTGCSLKRCTPREPGFSSFGGYHEIACGADDASFWFALLGGEYYSEKLVPVRICNAPPVVSVVFAVFVVFVCVMHGICVIQGICVMWV